MGRSRIPPALIALWQFLKDSKTVDGWTENYEQIVGKKALVSAKA